MSLLFFIRLLKNAAKNLPRFGAQLFAELCTDIKKRRPKAACAALIAVFFCFKCLNRLYQLAKLPLVGALLLQ